MHPDLLAYGKCNVSVKKVINFPHLSRMLTAYLISEISNFIFEFFINFRQYIYLNTFPNELKSYYKEEDYTKNRKYKQELTRLNLVQDSTTIFFDIYLFTRYDDIYNYYRFASPLLQAIVFLLTTFALHFVVKLPFDYYKHFNIEKSYGFNKMTFGLYVKDKIKWSIIGSLLFSVFLAGLSFVIHINVFVIWAALVSFQVLVLLIGPHIMAIFNKFEVCKDELKAKISKMCKKVGYPLGGVYTMDQGQRSSHSNAFMYGLFTKYIVLFDTLLKQLNDNEIVAVLNHELGHWSYSHIPKLVAHQCAWYLLICVSYPWFVNYAEGASNTYLANDLIKFVIYFQLLGPLTQLMSISQHALTRLFEYQADKFAFEHGYGMELQSALDKLQRENLGVYSDWVYALTKESHPRVLERLTVLKELMSEKKVD